MELVALLLLVGLTWYSAKQAHLTDKELENTWTATEVEKLEKRRALYDVCAGTGFTMIVLVLTTAVVMTIPDEIIAGKGNPEVESKMPASSQLIGP